MLPSLSRTEYKKQISLLRDKLYNEQRQFRKKKTSPLLLVIGGAGKHDTANTITSWMDPRGLSTYEFAENNAAELERPEFWRYWQTLPAKGEIGIYLGAWYNRPLSDQAYQRSDSVTYERYLSRIKTLEKQLTEDGALIIKLWISISKSEQEKRLHMLKENPLTRWRVTQTEEKQAQHYDQFKTSANQLLKKTSYPYAKWHEIKGDNTKHRMITAAQIFQDLLHSHQDKNSLLTKKLIPVAPKKNNNAYITNMKLDLEKHLEKNAYKNKLEKYRGRLHELSIESIKKGVSTVLVFEGVDAAGKGGAIRRLIVAFEAHRYRVVQIAKPTEEEKRYHYLWRFWQHVPTKGMTTIFDRSWYGRVLVERVEGFATTEEWNRAYSEINDFEKQLLENNTAVIKFWIQISKDEQLKRFRARQNTPHKEWKINEEDWRNREKWEQYEEAAEKMIGLTSTDFAPWTIVEGNDKRFARVKVIKTVCEQLEQTINRAVN
ncbi:MAG: polyphosphate:AMP phosphotransferase [Candidatus Latescibacterota bacterium]|nr:polyphosphate:AMP phosphotransferase [Candidatus Latescibacterota bacterium]